MGFTVITAMNFGFRVVGVSGLGLKLQLFRAIFRYLAKKDM